MKKQLLILTLAALLLAGCGATSAAESTVPAQSESTAAAETPDTAEATPAAALPDGVYTAEFKTDSSMFHANEACEGMGTLTVADGKMVFHVSLQSQKIVNLYPGTAADAPAHEADWLQPTLDTVTYSDGTTDEVYGFDIPVEAVDTDFSLAILGTKGTWYDHIVSVADAVPAAGDAAEAVLPEDGSYTCAVTLTGGSGRATVESPAALTVADGAMTAVIVWSSPNYDYMLVDGEKYLPTNTEGNSTFEIPVAALDTALASIQRYNELAKAGSDDDFGKPASRMFALENPPYYACQWGTTAMLVCVGGLESDENCHTFTEEDPASPKRDIIKGLYVCGNVQGSRYAVEYPICMRGISHSLCVYYGYIAGKNCVAGV